MRERYSVVDVAAWVAQSEARKGKALMSNERIWDDGFLVTLFDGPTPPERCDFHINTSPEFFYQLRGDMSCRILEDGRFRDFVVAEGEMFMLPALVPHLNARVEGSIGLVIHQSRAPGAREAIVWYCERCCAQLHREDYVFEDLQRQLPGFIRRFLGDEGLRTCKSCGAVLDPARGYM
jgi:3-hydroxyanthranilate 3,4-dioxygenase